MIIGEYILLALLLISAVFIVVSITIQKSSEDGLSGAISGKADTHYARELASRRGQSLSKWTLIAVVAFVVCALIVYIIQPDYSSTTNFLDNWKEVTKYNFIFS